MTPNCSAATRTTTGSISTASIVRFGVGRLDSAYRSAAAHSQDQHPMTAREQRTDGEVLPVPGSAASVQIERRVHRPLLIENQAA